MLIGDKMRAKGRAILPSYVFTGSVSSASDLTAYTFTGRNIGPASASRLVVVTAMLRSTSSNSFSGITVGGIALTPIIAQNAAQTNVGIYAGLVPTGTTADVVVTMTGGALRCVIGVYALYDLDSIVARDTGTSTASPLSLDLDILAGGIGVACAYTAGTTGETWAGMTEDFDLSPEGAHSLGASVKLPGAAIPRTVSLTLTGATSQGGVSASWR